ncbi:MAG TPA: putative phage tail protein [Acetobacteraceae bacterium]|nr:putative phage tail protein [Acetobacteraceae bacterium]
MLAPEASATDYLWQFQRLLPRGRIWQRGWGTLQAEVLLTLMPTWARLHARANGLLPDAFPCSTVELLPEWEATLGLPDPCVQPPLATLQQRTAAVCAKFAARGGQSQAYYRHLAASLGYQIEIETFTPFRVGWSQAGDALCGAEWAFGWRIVVQGDVGTVTYFRTGKSAVGEPLASWGIAALQCIFENNMPAHTVPIWSYQINSSIWDGGDSIWDQGDSVWDQGVTVSP